MFICVCQRGSAANQKPLCRDFKVLSPSLVPVVIPEVLRRPPSLNHIYFNVMRETEKERVLQLPTGLSEAQPDNFQ